MNIISLVTYLVYNILNIPFVGSTLLLLCGLASCLTIFKCLKCMFAD